MPLIDSVIQGGVGIASGIIGHKKRKAEQATAQSQYDQNMTRYQSQDLSNPYANMENVYEDLTVNTQAADFAAQQQSQGMANTMQGMKGAAGGSGIAALAQAMAGQQSQNAQGASADIARQEAGNQKAQAQMAGQLQSMEREGDMISRSLEREQSETELGMSQQRLGAANIARQEATQALVGGIGQVAGGVMKANPAIAAMGELAGGEGVGGFVGNLFK
mgnify:FL=1|tara:strand:+ start:3870 stop:4526 length:657 start_codon:yes stop_codon:yes gene_type:complete